MTRVAALFALLAVLPASAHAGGEVKAGRFRIYFSGANGAELDWAVALFEKADRELAPLFGNGAPAEIDVTLSRSDREWKVDVGEDSWAAGLVDGTNEIFVKLPTRFWDLPGLEATIRHEVIHAMLGTRFNATAPRWLVEGIACHFSGRKRAPPTIAFADDAAINRALVGDDAHARWQAYAAASAKVGTLVAECGGPNVVAWVLELRTNRVAVLRKEGEPCRPPSLASVAPRESQPVPTSAIAVRLSSSRGPVPARVHDATKKQLTLLSGELPRCNEVPWDRLLAVEVVVVADKDGNVISTEIDGAVPCAAIAGEAAASWRFAPLVVDGVAVPWKRTLEVVFSESRTTVR